MVIKPFWHKYLNNPDFDVTASEDESFVSISYLKAVSAEDMRDALENQLPIETKS